MNLIGPSSGDPGDRISVTDAVDKQLGLKLEERKILTDVLVVDSVLRTPTPNAPNIVEALPPIPVPTEFEVASVKMADPGSRSSRFQMLPGRFLSEGMPLTFLIQRAFNTANAEQIAGVPPFAQSERYDINARLPGEGTPGPTDPETLAPMLLSLLKERFKLAYHTEERPVTAYSLVAANPRMKKADPASRTWCKTPPPSPATPPGSRVLTCQNVTMGQFADRLQGLARELVWPVTDATGLEGTWDFTLTFSIASLLPAGVAGGASGAGGVGGAPPGNVPGAADPTGIITIFDAMERQLGLKLARQKRAAAVFVIDHLEPKPTEN